MQKNLKPQDFVNRGVWFINKGCLCKQKVIRVDAMFYDGFGFTTKLHLEHYGAIDPCRCFLTKTAARAHRKEDLEHQLRSAKIELSYFEKGVTDRKAKVEDLTKRINMEEERCSKHTQQ